MAIVGSIHWKYTSIATKNAEFQTSNLNKITSRANKWWYNMKCNDKPTPAYLRWSSWSCPPTRERKLPNVKYFSLTREWVSWIHKTDIWRRITTGVICNRFSFVKPSTFQIEMQKQWEELQIWALALDWKRNARELSGEANCKIKRLHTCLPSCR